MQLLSSSSTLDKGGQSSGSHEILVLQVAASIEGKRNSFSFSMRIENSAQ